ncbi:MAG: YbjN domain-containing protein [Pseudomonadota bacterium]
MTTKRSSNKQPAFSPISYLEESSENMGWECEYQDETEIRLKFGQDWGLCAMDWLWVEEWHTLSCIVSSNMHIPEERQDDIRDLILMINEQMWVGHFDLSQGGHPTFRYSLLVKGLNRKQVGNMIEKTIEIALREWARYHAAFHFVSWGGAESSQKMLSPTLIETAGEA